MNRAFLLNIFFLVAINLLVKPLYIFAIDLQVQNTVGEAAYGAYFTLMNFTMILEIVNDFGMRNFLRRYLSQNTQVLEKYFPYLLSLKLLFSIAYGSAVFLIGLLFGYTQSYLLLLSVIVASRICVGFIELFRANLVGLSHYRSDSFLSVAHRLFAVLFSGILLYHPAFRADFNIQWFALAELSALFITMLIAGVMLRRKITAIRFRFKLPLLLLLVKKSYPYALIILLMMIYNRVDAIMIEQLVEAGNKEAGIYAAGYRLLDAATMFSLLFANLLLPMFSKMLKQGENIQTLMQTSFQLIMVGVISGVTAIFCFRVEIMALLYTDATNYWGEILGVLMLSFVAISATHIVGTALVANDDVMRLNQIYLGGIVVNLLLNFIFIPPYGAYGAAITTCCTQFFVVFGQFWLIERLFKLPIRFLLLRVAVFAILLVGLVYWSFGAIHIGWQIHFGLILITGLGLGFLLRLIRVRAVRTILE